MAKTPNFSVLNIMINVTQMSVSKQGYWLALTLVSLMARPRSHDMYMIFIGKRSTSRMTKCNEDVNIKCLFYSEKGWTGIVGQPPTKEQFAEVYNSVCFTVRKVGRVLLGSLQLRNSLLKYITLFVLQ